MLNRSISPLRPPCWISELMFSAVMKDWIAKGYDVIALVPSCALMLKFEWPLILPDDSDVAALAKATFDISEYVVDIARNEGIAPGLTPTPPPGPGAPPSHALHRVPARPGAARARGRVNARGAMRPVTGSRRGRWRW